MGSDILKGPFPTGPRSPLPGILPSARRLVTQPRNSTAYEPSPPRQRSNATSKRTHPRTCCAMHAITPPPRLQHSQSQPLPSPKHTTLRRFIPASHIPSSTMTSPHAVLSPQKVLYSHGASPQDDPGSTFPWYGSTPAPPRRIPRFKDATPAPAVPLPPKWPYSYHGPCTTDPSTSSPVSLAKH